MYKISDMVFLIGKTQLRLHVAIMKLRTQLHEKLIFHKQ